MSMRKINVTAWTEEQKEEFWEEWCAIGGYTDDMNYDDPVGMPWTYTDYIEVKSSDRTMRDFARTYKAQTELDEE